jgi:hypothetical protein
LAFFQRMSFEAWGFLSRSADRVRAANGGPHQILEFTATLSGYNHHVFVVGIARQQLENAIENAALRHRLKRWYTMFQSPKRAGKSRQGTPVRYL